MNSSCRITNHEPGCIFLWLMYARAAIRRRAASPLSLAKQEELIPTCTSGPREPCSLLPESTRLHVSLHLLEASRNRDTHRPVHCRAYRETEHRPLPGRRDHMIEIPHHRSSHT